MSIGQVFDKRDTQMGIFERTAKPIVHSVLEGYNGAGYSKRICAVDIAHLPTSTPLPGASARPECLNVCGHPSTLRHHFRVRPGATQRRLPAVPQPALFLSVLHSRTTPA